MSAVHPALAQGRPCPICGARAAEVAAVARPVRCRDCGLVYVDPVPPEAIATGTYGSDYYEPWQGAEEGPRRRMWNSRLRRLRRRVSSIGTLLDVGCGDGLFALLAKEAGWRVDAIEFSPEGARRAAARLGRPVAVGDLARSLHLPGPFEVITLWHVLEHLPEPRAMLEAARRRLTPGGLLVVAVPNLDNLPMRAAYRVARRRPYPLYEPGAREPHLSHFSPHTLRAILERGGFGEIRITTDTCALTLPKRAIDQCAALAGFFGGRILTDALTAFARRLP
ncbi:MAG TPA: class I SAM-dependent methyltransferase [Dongiaceae bacterium]|nr:class I SAM-dependent methyltransferase [Dongiaceae bacterium]